MSAEGHLPVPRTDAFGPPAEYRALRGCAPVRVSLPGGRSAWAVCRMADVRTVLTDPRVSSDGRRPGFPNPYVAHDVARSGEPDPVPLVEMDGAQHAAYRRMLISEFSVRKVDALRPFVQDLVDGLIDRMLADGPKADLVSAFALPIPSTVIARLLGVPASDHAFFQDRTARAISTSARDEEWHAALLELHAYMADLVMRKQREPADDLLSRLAAKAVLSTERLTQLAVFLLASGFQSTANMIALGVLTFLRYPDQLAALRADATSAADEMVRFHSLSDIDLTRITIADLDLGGTTIPAGEGIIPILSAANRDETVFDHPDEPDLARANGRHHVGFGFGVHQCLGQNLARAELQIAYRTLFTRLPNLQLATDFDEVDVRSDARLFGLNTLPVTW